MKIKTLTNKIEVMKTEINKLLLKYGMICDPDIKEPVCQRCKDLDKELNDILNKRMPSDEEINIIANEWRDGWLYDAKGEFKCSTIGVDDALVNFKIGYARAVSDFKKQLKQ